ncbi:MAG: hypothetical protein ROW39_01330, partial [Anaerolineaceae bacterium]
IEVIVDQPIDSIHRALEKVPEIIKVHSYDSIGYRIEATRDIRPEAAEAVISAGGRLLHLGVHAQSLDDIYSAYFKEVEHDGTRLTTTQ